MLVIDGDDRVVFANRAHEALTGLGRAELHGRSLWDQVPVTHETQLRALLQDLRADGCTRAFESTWPCKEGETRTLALLASCLPSDVDPDMVTLTGIDVTERELDREWRERFEGVLGIATDAILMVDDEQRIVFYNDGARGVFGWSPVEALGRPLETLIPQRFRARHRKHMESFLAGEAVSRFLDERQAQVIGLRKSGEEFPAEAAVCKADVRGRRTCAVVLRDVSERLRDEERLRLGAERLRVALQASPVVVFNQDRDLRYTWIHSPGDPSRPAAIGKTDLELLPRLEAERLVAIKSKVLETGVGRRAVVRTTLDGDPRDYDLTVEPLRTPDGRVEGITCAAWNVTAQRRARDEQRFLARVGTLVMTASLDYEDTLAQLGELAVSELADWCLIDIVERGQVRRLKVTCSNPDASALADALENVHLDRQRPHLMFEPLEHRTTKLLSHVTAEYLESIAQRPEHASLLRAMDIGSMIAVPLIAHGRLVGAIAMLSSSSGRYDEEHLRFVEEFARVAALAVENARLYRSAQRAISARDEVLRVVAHDLRNPLNHILLQSELLSEGRPSLRSGRKPVDVIRTAAQRMKRLIEDMLDVARLELGVLAVERTALEARDVLEEAFEAKVDEATRAGLHLRLDASEDLCVLLGDRDRLLQVFENLLSNAIKFSTPGEEIVLGGEPRGDDVLFWVEDTGSGIAEKHLPRLFDPFWQAVETDRRGIGLGLPIVKGIVEAHGGTVWVESRIGDGTTVFFTVPTPAARSEAHPAS